MTMSPKTSDNSDSSISRDDSDDRLPGLVPDSDSSSASHEEACPSRYWRISSSSRTKVNRSSPLLTFVSNDEDNISSSHDALGATPTTASASGAKAHPVTASRPDRSASKAVDPESRHTCDDVNEEKHVRWGKIEVRKYPIEPGEHPDCQTGAPVCVQCRCMPFFRRLDIRFIRHLNPSFFPPPELLLFLVL